jgi:hypothetical protein
MYLCDERVCGMLVMILGFPSQLLLRQSQRLLPAPPHLCASQPFFHLHLITPGFELNDRANNSRGSVNHFHLRNIHISGSGLRPYIDLSCPTKSLKSALNCRQLVITLRKEESMNESDFEIAARDCPLEVLQKASRALQSLGLARKGEQHTN